MAKWADYGISHKRFESGMKHISHLKVRDDLGGGTFSSGEEWTLKKVIAAIEDKNDPKTFVTILWRDGQWKIGAKVDVVPVNGVKYLRTNRDKTAADNLDNLPDF